MGYYGLYVNVILALDSTSRKEQIGLGLGLLFLTKPIWGCLALACLLKTMNVSMTQGMENLSNSGTGMVRTAHLFSSLDNNNPQIHELLRTFFGAESPPYEVSAGAMLHTVNVANILSQET